MVRNRALIEIVVTHTGCAPTQAYPGDAGWDLYVAKRTILEPFVPTDIPCGFDIGLAEGYWARIAARSSTVRKHRILVGDAVIDAGYRGPMFVCVTRIHTTSVVIEEGQRLAQLILHRVEPVAWQHTMALSQTVRGERSFGSSGL